MARVTVVATVVVVAVLALWASTACALDEDELVQIERLKRFVEEHANGKPPQPLCACRWGDRRLTRARRIACITATLEALPSATCSKAASVASQLASCGVPYVYGGTNCNACSDKKAGGTARRHLARGIATLGR